MTECKYLSEKEIERPLFQSFIRRQQVKDCVRKEKGVWVIKPDPFVDDWSEQDYEVLVQCLKNTVRIGGAVLGAFLDGKLKGFASVEKEPLGSKGQYRDLTCIHVSQDVRGHGIGKRLFLMASEFAREKGGEKLYISAHSAVETQAFYRAMGCVEAEEYSEEHVKREPYDCQMEKVL